MKNNRLKTPSLRLKQIFVENIYTYRKIKQISQEGLADLYGLHRTYVGSVERGEKNVTLSTLENFSAILDVEVPRLLTEKAFKDDS